MNADYVMLIREHDKTLSMLRENMMETEEDSKERTKWVDRINGALDHRLELMRLRDERD